VSCLPCLFRRLATKPKQEIFHDAKRRTAASAFELRINFHKPCEGLGKLIIGKLFQEASHPRRVHSQIASGFTLSTA
jgi:hypothetical protein